MRVVLAMSGGVDSSVAARLLVDQGHEVIGLFMRTGAHADPGDEPLPIVRPHGCCSALDARDAERVALRLDIPFYALNFSDDFRRIQDYFVAEYDQGRTPNPCVVCNTWLKFGKLWRFAQSIGAGAIATGHYARVRHGTMGAELHQGADPAKDQSYFLFGIDREILMHVLFPIGELQKSEVRQRARDFSLPVSEKPDSQEICFVPTGRYQDFLEKHSPNGGVAGAIVDRDGQILGNHAGLRHFTIGQRKGLGFAVGEPRYVLELDASTNTVIVGSRADLARTEAWVNQVHWLIDPPKGPVECAVKIRYLHAPARAEVFCDGREKARIVFREEQTAITPGQAAVFYDGTRVLGGGWIANLVPAK